MKEKLSLKTITLLVSPILLFFVVFLPYCHVNSAFLVERLGCGCPQIDANGNLYEPAFNANDFTRCFFLFISLCATVISVFLSKRIFRKKLFLRICYVAGIAVVSLLITARFCRALMWC